MIEISISAYFVGGPLHSKLAVIPDVEECYYPISSGSVLSDGGNFTIQKALYKRIWTGNNCEAPEAVFAFMGTQYKFVDKEKEG